MKLRTAHKAKRTEPWPGPSTQKRESMSAKGGGLNRSPQHSILKGKGVYGDGARIFSRLYSGREDRALGSLATRRVTQGDWACVWQTVIVHLFSTGTARWNSACTTPSLEVGIDAGRS